MACLTYCLEIAIIIRAAMCFGFNMVNRCCRGNDPLFSAHLADEIITLHNAFAYQRPGVAITSLFVRSPRTLRLPACTAMLFAIPAPVRCRAGASALTACPRCSWWHIITFTVSIAISYAAHQRRIKKPPPHSQPKTSEAIGNRSGQ